MNPYAEMKKDKYVKKGDNKTLKELRKLYVENYDYTTPLSSSLVISEFVHSNDLKKVLFCKQCEEDEKIQILNNIK